MPQKRNPDEIRDLVAQARVEEAFTGTKALVAKTNLAPLFVALSNAYYQFKQDGIAGILSYDEKTRTVAQINSRLLDLLRQYELLQLKNLKVLIDELQQECPAASSSEESTPMAMELEHISRSLEVIDSVNSKKDVDPSLLERINAFVKKVSDPTTPEGTAIKNVKSGVVLVQKIGRQYNAVAQWFALPQIPSILLGTAAEK